MKARVAMFAAAIAAVLLGGCTTSPSERIMGAAPVQCQNGSAACDVAVGVYCPASPQAKCLVSVDANVVELKTSAGARKVTWRLPAGGDWQFGNPGIVFASAPFSCSANGPFVYECSATSNDVGQFKYKVVVAPRGINRSADPLDPWVVTN